MGLKPGEFKKWAQDLNKETVTRRLKAKEAKAGALEIWPWLGLDREHAASYLASLSTGGKFRLNPEILGVLEWTKVDEWIQRNGTRITPEFLYQIAGLGFAVGRSDVKRRQAHAKNERPRMFVLSAWMLREDKDQSKAAFGRQYALLVKRKYGLVVTPETITRMWLPKQISSK